MACISRVAQEPPNIQSKEIDTMTKERTSTKEPKKKAEHTLKEKRATKKEKSSAKGSLGSVRAVAC